MTSFVIMTATAKAPGGAWKRTHYKRIGLLEIEDTADPEKLRIDERCKGVVRVIKTWEQLRVGLTERSQYARAYAEASELLGILQNEFTRMVWEKGGG